MLSLANNQLTGLPSSLSSLTSLRKLNLSHNLIQHIPGCVYNMKALVLTLFNQPVSQSASQPASLNSFPSYFPQVFLHLACNRLENMAESIQGLVQLKILIVEGNSLNALPKALCCLVQLELLNLDFNQLKDVPQEMHQLFRLERLACHPLDKGLHILHNPLLKPIKEVLEGGLSALYNYLRAT